MYIIWFINSKASLKYKLLKIIMTTTKAVIIPVAVTVGHDSPGRKS